MHNMHEHNFDEKREYDYEKNTKNTYFSTVWSNSDQMSANVYKTKKHEYVLALMYIKKKMIVNMLAWIWFN